MAYELAGMNLVLFIVLIVWSGIWKGIGLWRAGKNNHLVWFILMFVLNTAGILPLIYIVFFSKPEEVKEKKDIKSKEDLTEI